MFKTKFKRFNAWQDEQEEQWLASMSAQGWHLIRLKGISSYEFRKGDPANYTYRLDFHEVSKKDRADYLALFADAGWEHLGEMSGWQYFRRLHSENVPVEIFTDTDSKMAKYKRVKTNQYYLLVIYLALWVVFSGGGFEHWWDYLLPAVFILLMGSIGYNLFRIERRVKELERTQLVMGEESR